MMVLSNLATSESGIIVKVNGQGVFKKRLMEMGFIRGQKITVIKNAPLKDPVEYSVMGYKVSLRRSEAALVEVMPFSEKDLRQGQTSILSENESFSTGDGQRKVINVGLIGNPNSGKTSIFNFASRSKEHVANYGGVTVDTKLARFEHLGIHFNIFDLPGTYSLSSYSPEEIYVRNFISHNTPDIIINVVDATNLERNLYLTTQLVDLNVKVVIALNMFDEMTSRGDRFDHVTFSRMTGIPVIPTIGTKGKGIARLLEAIIKRFHEEPGKVRRIRINYGQDVERSITRIQEAIQEDDGIRSLRNFPSRFTAIKLLEKDTEIHAKISDSPEYNHIIEIANKEITRLENLSYDDTPTLMTDARYGFINGLLKETYTVSFSEKKQRSERIDKILTHKFLGLPFFLLFLWVMFQATFRIGQYPMDWIDQGVRTISGFVESSMAPGDLKNLLIDGVIGGIGGVIIFLPNILILFFFISILEDTGYMARAAFLVDKVMHKIGLHGKSFIPMVMGFGCNVPGIMSTRIIESRNNRIITMLILPFMSCSARLPVYILLIGTFFPSYQGTILFGLYLAGILIAALTAIILKKFYFRQQDIPFVMELPPYRVPTVKNTLRHMSDKAGQYLQKIAGVVLIASVIIWGLGYYPSGIRQGVPAEKGPSYLEHIGKFVEPAISPLGFDWKMGVSILSGIAGKEIVVSSMGVIYNNDAPGDIKKSLSEKLKNEKHPDGRAVYTPLAVISFLLFILIYFPCIPVVITIAKESGSVMWSVFLILYTTGLAWMISFLAYQGGNLIKLIEL